MTLFALVTVKTESGKTQTKRVRIGSERFSVSPGRSRRVSVKISRRGRRMLRRRGRLAVQAQIEARDLASNVTVDRARVWLHPRQS